MSNEHSDFSWEAFKIMLLWAGGAIAHNYHIIAGNIFITLSIFYLIWKWHRDYKKEKKV